MEIVNEPKIDPSHKNNENNGNEIGFFSASQEFIEDPPESVLNHCKDTDSPGKNYDHVLRKNKEILSNIDDIELRNIKQGDLEHDMKMGWVPKILLKGPIPLRFYIDYENWEKELLDKRQLKKEELIEEKTENESKEKSETEKEELSRVVYIGYRPQTSFDLHRKYYSEGKNYSFNQLQICNGKVLETFFEKNSMFFKKNKTLNSPPPPLNEVSEEPLIFDSDFEGGNLEAAYLVNGEYFLKIRPDSNTRGHCNYFNFKINCKIVGTYKFTIINMSKKKSLYERGMKPYVKIWRAQGDSSWKQSCTNIIYQLRQDFYENVKKKKAFYELKFDYNFTESNTIVQFCYGIPFTYTELCKNIEKWRQNPNFHVTKLCQSLSGVNVPLITITESGISLKEFNSKKNSHLKEFGSKDNSDEIESKSKSKSKEIEQKEIESKSKEMESKEIEEKRFESKEMDLEEKHKEIKEKHKENHFDRQENNFDGEENNEKFIVMISARIHPSETHSSHILNGFIENLLSNSNESVELRKKYIYKYFRLIFKIIPMMNPDGVILGNTRTSFAGKDLNRVYSDKINVVFPEIIAHRELMKKLSEKYKENFLFAIDVHGHSIRKNSFFYGPEHPITHDKYLKSRVLPKLFGNLTEVFRYYSCKFRIDESKKQSCRGYFNSKNIVPTYTFEISMHGYFNFKERKDKAFNIEILNGLGKDMLLAIHEYVKMEPKKEISSEIKKELLVPEEKNSHNSDDEDLSSKADSESSSDNLAEEQLESFHQKINQNSKAFTQYLFPQGIDPVSHKKSNKKLQRSSERNSKKKMSLLDFSQKIKEKEKKEENKKEHKNEITKMNQLPQLGREKKTRSEWSCMNGKYSPDQPPRKIKLTPKTKTLDSACDEAEQVDLGEIKVEGEIENIQNSKPSKNSKQFYKDSSMRILLCKESHGQCNKSMLLKNPTEERYLVFKKEEKKEKTVVCAKLFDSSSLQQLTNPKNLGVLYQSESRRSLTKSRAPSCDKIIPQNNVSFAVQISERKGSIKGIDISEKEKGNKTGMEKEMRNKVKSLVMRLPVIEKFHRFERNHGSKEFE